MGGAAFKSFRELAEALSFTPDGVVERPVDGDVYWIPFVDLAFGDRASHGPRRPWIVGLARLPGGLAQVHPRTTQITGSAAEVRVPLDLLSPGIDRDGAFLARVRRKVAREQFSGFEWVATVPDSFVRELRAKQAGRA